MILLGLVLLGYLLGSLPTGPVLVRWLKNTDLRQHGSGNTGAANVYRAAGPRIAGCVLALDLVKGAVPVYLAKATLERPSGHVLVGLAAVTGHLWSIFLGFKGGKGVLTALGGLYVLAPPSALLATIVGGAVIAIWRYSSLGSLTGTLVGASSLLGMIAAGKRPVGYLGQVVIVPALIIFTHRENIRNLIDGTERKLVRATPVD